MTLNPVRYLPSQTLTPAQKREAYTTIQNWAEVTMNYYISASYSGMMNATVGFHPFYGTGTSSIWYKKLMYDVYAGSYYYDSYDILIQPFKDKGLAIPTIPKNFNIIKSRVDTLRGEEMTRMFSVNFFGTNHDVVNQKQKIIDDLKVQKELADTLLVWRDKHGLPVDEEKISEVMKDWQQYSSGEGKLYLEKLASDIFDYLEEKTDWKRKTNEGFFHLLVTSSEYYKVESYGEAVDFRVVNPLNMFHSIPSNSLFVDDAEWIVERRFMDITDIISEFSDYLTDEEVEMLGSMGRPEFDSGAALLGSSSMMAGPYGSYGNYKLYVYNVEWVSKTKILQVTRKDKMSGMDLTFLVTDSDKYKKRKGDKVKHKWVNEVWEGVRIGGRLDGYNLDTDFSSCIYVRVRKKPNQYRSIDNMAKVKLGYTGVYSMIQNTISQSLVGYGMIYQELYNIVWFRIERLMAQAKGKVIGIDTAMLDQSKMSLEQQLYYISSDGVFYFNSMAMLEATGSLSPVNQFPQYDLTLSNSLNQYLGILNALKEEWEELSGLNRQRLGEVKSTETVGGVERAVTQSNMITEPYFFIHNQIKKRLALLLVEEAKHAWKDGFLTSYAVGEIGSKILSVLPGEMMFIDYGISAGDSSKQRMIMQKLDGLAQFALQSGQTSLLNTIDILVSDSIAEIQSKLKEAVQQRQVEIQQAQEQEMQMKNMELQSKLQIETAKLEQQERFHQQDTQLEKELADLKAQTEKMKTLYSYRDGILRAQLEAEKLKGDNPDRMEELDRLIKQTTDEANQLGQYDDLLNQLNNGTYVPEETNQTME